MNYARRLDRFRRLLRRVPDEIILAVASRHLELGEPTQCVCGWVIREAIGGLAQQDPEEISLGLDFEESWVEDGPRTIPRRLRRKLDDAGGIPPNMCAALYGGRPDSWEMLYYGVTDEADPDYAPIEQAFVERVRAAAHA